MREGKGKKTQERGIPTAGEEEGGFTPGSSSEQVLPSQPVPVAGWMGASATSAPSGPWLPVWNSIPLLGRKLTASWLSADPIDCTVGDVCRLNSHRFCLKALLSVSYPGSLLSLKSSEGYRGEWDDCHSTGWIMSEKKEANGFDVKFR